MKRGGFKPKVYQRPPRAPLVRREPTQRAVVEARPAVAALLRPPVRISKERPLQHEGYMDLVRALACAHCRKPPRSQFCHADEGKGMQIKTDCRRGWPGCAECHYLIGSTGTFKRAVRRELEDRYAAQTRKQIVACGLWPARLPRWPE